MPFVTFFPRGLRVECSSGESVFEAARRAGLPVQTACMGRGTCGLCRVKVVGADAGLSPFAPAERRHLGTVYFLTRERLACQAQLVGDAEVAVQIPPLKTKPGS